MIDRNEIDYPYICSKMSDMSGLPVRIYTGKSVDALFSVSPAVADPVKKYEKDLLKGKDHVSYFIAENMDYYGVIRSRNKTIIIGPSRAVPYTVQEMSDLAFDLGVSGKDRDAFIRFLRSIIPMPLGSVLQMLCSLNYLLNDEKLNITDLGYTGSLVPEYFSYEEGPVQSSDVFKSYRSEEQILDIVKSGDTGKIDEWAKNAPTFRSGVTASNQLRQDKNTFITSAALVSRAAIEAGMDIEDAVKKCDSFVQRCENVHDIRGLRRLQYELVNTYTSEVGMVKSLTDGSRLVHDVYRYVTAHISETIRTDEIAAALFMSRSYLCTSFRKQTGITLNGYIHKIKTEKAKELLPDQTKSIGLISDYLGYSSSSHFNRVFKNVTGMTPLEYRKKHQA